MSEDTKKFSEEKKVTADTKTKSTDPIQELVSPEVYNRRKKMRELSVGDRGPLYIPEEYLDSRFVYRWAHYRLEHGSYVDLDIEEHKRKGYDFSPPIPGLYIGSGVTDLSRFQDTEGSRVLISLGGGSVGVLMRIPKEWHEENKAALEELNKRYDLAPQDPELKQEMTIKR